MNNYPSSVTHSKHNIPNQLVKVRLSTKQNELEVIIIKNKYMINNCYFTVNN